MTGQTIIENFETYVDDTTELSSVQELALANKIYRKILDSQAWEFLKKEYTGTTDGTAYLALPSDFKYMLQNYSYTDLATEQGGIRIFVGPTRTPYKLVNWSDRQQYYQSRDVCYLDIVNSRIVFPVAPTTGYAVSYDYIYKPDDLTTATSPVYPSEYHAGIYHGMATEDYIIQQFDKARSYSGENRAMYKEYLDRLINYNSNLVQINL